MCEPLLSRKGKGVAGVTMSVHGSVLIQRVILAPQGRKNNLIGEMLAALACVTQESALVPVQHRKRSGTIIVTTFCSALVGL